MANEREINVSDEMPTRCGFVALIGAPNAGKSTITNNFVGSKVSIVPLVSATKKICFTVPSLNAIAQSGE